jgi:hypothetical protein
MLLGSGYSILEGFEALYYLLSFCPQALYPAIGTVILTSVNGQIHNGITFGQGVLFHLF